MPNDLDLTVTPWWYHLAKHKLPPGKTRYTKETRHFRKAFLEKGGWFLRRKPVGWNIKVDHKFSIDSNNSGGLTKVLLKEHARIRKYSRSKPRCQPTRAKSSDDVPPRVTIEISRKYE